MSILRYSVIYETLKKAVYAETFVNFVLDIKFAAACAVLFGNIPSPIEKFKFLTFILNVCVYIKYFYFCKQ